MFGYGYRPWSNESTLRVRILSPLAQALRPYRRTQRVDMQSMWRQNLCIFFPIRKFLADLTCNQVYVDMYFVTVTCTMLHVNNKNSNRGRFVMRIKTFSHVNPICYMSTCNHEYIVYVMYMLHVSYIYMLVVMHVDFIEACRQ